MARETYGTAHAPAGDGSTIVEVEAGSDAAGAGMVPGERVIAVDGVPVSDVIDWRWATEEAQFTVSLHSLRGPREVTVQRTGGPLGVSFKDIVFDGVHECENACTFCFVSQLPRGLRSSLYVRDDDFRLSFLNGTFITLTNLTGDDVERIATQGLSPLYVSLHAVDHEVRRRLICPTVDDTALEWFDALLERGIRLHVQIVLVPGVNDGDVLDETLEWLSRRPGVESVGVVPLGYTGHQSRFDRSFGDPVDAAGVLEQLAGWQERRDEDGGAWVQAADEFYIAARWQLPDSSEYGAFPQYENGIGLTRAFIDALKSAAVGVHAERDVCLVTGELIAPLMRETLARVGLGGSVRVLAVHNDLLGGGVSVTGLLCGADIVRALAQEAHDVTYLVPDVVVNSDGLLLDDTPAGLLGELSGRDVRIVPTDARSIIDAVSG